MEGQEDIGWFVVMLCNCLFVELVEVLLDLAGLVFRLELKSSLMN